MPRLKEQKKVNNVKLPFKILCDVLERGFAKGLQISDGVHSNLYNQDRPTYSNTQCWLMLKALASGDMLDISDLGKATGSFNPKARLTEARRIARSYGVSIKDEWAKGVNRLGHRTRFKIYFLEKADCDKINAAMVKA